MVFATYDNDNSPGGCAKAYGTGWWYDNCGDANLNGYYGYAFLWYGCSYGTNLEQSRMMTKAV